MSTLCLKRSIFCSVWLVSFLLMMTSCATRPRITLSSAQPDSTLTLVPLKNLYAPGRTLTNPVTVEPSKLKDSAIRITAPGKTTQFWLMPAQSGQGGEIKVKQLAGCGEKEQKEKEASFQNRPIRILIKAYQALFAKDLAVAQDLARKTAELEPNLAAPHIIIGLAFYYQGQKEQARVSFNRAAALDPEDSDINQLIRMAQ